MKQEEFDRLQAHAKNPGRLVKIGRVVAPQCERPKVTACHLWQQEECGCTPVSGCQKLDADPVPIKPLPHVFRSGRSKYKNVKTGRYSSKKEAKRAGELKLLQDAGEIRNLREQVEKLIIVPQRDGNGKHVRSCSYVCDFVYERDGVEVWEDVKGHLTEVYKLKKKLMLWVHGITILET